MNYKNYEWNKARDDEGNIIDGSYWVEYLPEPWLKAFGEEMCEELDSILNKSKHKENYYVSKVGERLGAMIWFCTMPIDIYVELDAWNTKYVELSRSIDINK